MGISYRNMRKCTCSKDSFNPCTLLTHDLHGINPLEICLDHGRVLYIQATQTAGHHLSSSCSQCVSDSWMLCEVCNLIYWFTTVPIPALNLLWAFGMTSCSSPFKVHSLRIGRYNTTGWAKEDKGMVTFQYFFPPPWELTLSHIPPHLVHL